ncbi:hypothetical protein BHE74_00029879 [Ensete ventricosum]|nr:hypothetical protein BHE74_00029879 [Ensete ventricosum]
MAESPVGNGSTDRTQDFERLNRSYPRIWTLSAGKLSRSTGEPSLRALRKENKVEVKQGKFTPSGESNFGPAGNMGEMKRSNSAEAFVPSVVSFAGLEGNNQKRHLWDWATASHNLNAAVPTTNHATIDLQSHPIFPPAPALDCPPLLFPMNHFPFCPPPSVPDFPVALIKTEDGIDSGGRIGLNLGQRTYFSSGDGHEMDHLFARSRGVYSLSHQPPRCQAEGCKVDLSGAKHYHRRHKVCEFHSKATVVIAHGLQQRFCQQCSRYDPFVSSITKTRRKKNPHPIPFFLQSMFPCLMLPIFLLVERACNAADEVWSC